MELPNKDEIKTLAENETYKYLGILEADSIKQAEMKEKIQKEYLRRTRKLLETKLNSSNLIKGINTWAVPLVRYSGPFLKLTREELKQMDQRTRKLMTMHKALHTRDDIDRLYVSRKEGGKGLASTEDSVEASIQRLKDYIEKHEGGLITAITNDTIAAWKKLRFILLVQSDFHMTKSQLIAVHAFVSRVSISVSVDETRHPRQVNLSTNCELCKKSQFDHTNKWYMHNPAYKRIT